MYEITLSGEPTTKSPGLEIAGSALTTTSVFVQVDLLNWNVGRSWGWLPWVRIIIGSG